MIPDNKVIKPRQVVLVTNMPTPYRSHLFDVFQERLNAIGVEFAVLYLAQTENGRYWQFDSGSVRHNHKFEKGIHLNTSTFRHINPATPLRLAGLRDSVLILGGYDNFATFLISAMPLRKSVMKVLWSESNLHSESRKDGISRAIKSFVLSKHEYFLVPGSLSEDFIGKYLPSVSVPQFIQLPNTIDEEVFNVGFSGLDREKARAEAGIADNEIVVFVSARLEPFKNVFFTLSAFPDEFWKRCRVFVAGSGSEQGKLEEFMMSKVLSSRLTLLGQVSSENMPRYYRIADIFLLPSLQDPSPLSCVEAINCGLPLAVSSHVGNHPEVLVQGKNGFLFDPSCRDEIRQLGEKISRIERMELEKMGEESRKIYNIFFRPHRIVDNAIEKLIKIYSEKHVS